MNILQATVSYERWMAAHIPLDRRAVSGVKRDLAKRPGSWLHKAAKAMLRATERDWREWKRN